MFNAGVEGDRIDWGNAHWTKMGKEVSQFYAANLGADCLCTAVGHRELMFNAGVDSPAMEAGSSCF